jgi:YidC/Oxa1 family membrane protein insertase
MMKLLPLMISAILLFTISGANAFAPVSRSHFGAAATSGTARSFGLDPSSFQDLHQHVDSFREAFTSLTLSDNVDAVVVVGVDPSAVMDAADAAAQGASTAAQSGWFGFLTAPIEGLLVLIHSSMVAMGMTSNAWGLSIILLTLLVKAVTFPLTKTQLESTNKMQVCRVFPLFGLFDSFVTFCPVS